MNNFDQSLNYPTITGLKSLELDELSAVDFKANTIDGDIIYYNKINHKVISARPYFDSVCGIYPSAPTCYQTSHTHTTLSASVSLAWALVGRIAYRWCAGGD